MATQSDRIAAGGALPAQKLKWLAKKLNYKKTAVRDRRGGRRVLLGVARTCWTSSSEYIILCQFTRVSTFTPWNDARVVYIITFWIPLGSVIAKSSDKSAATRTLVDEENFCSSRLFIIIFFWPHDRANFVFTTDISRYFLHVVYDIHASILLDEHVENSAKNYNTHIVRTKRTVNRAAGWHEEVGIHHRVREYKY